MAKRDEKARYERYEKFEMILVIITIAFIMFTGPILFLYSVFK